MNERREYVSPEMKIRPLQPASFAGNYGDPLNAPTNVRPVG